MTTAQVADELQVTQKTVLRWIKAGDVFPHAFKLPGRAGWRIPREDVEALRGRAEQETWQ
jgi:excisionase family DNA binding protein